MAVKVVWKAPNGSPKESEHEQGNDTHVSGTGHLFVRSVDARGVVEIVAGYAPGVWSTFAHAEKDD